MSKFPISWRKRRIGDIAEIVSGATPKTKVKEYWNGDILWATPKDLGQLNSIEISDTERKITKAGYESCSTKLLPPGSVLLSSRAPIGHFAINTRPMCTNQGFKSLIPKQGIFNRYLYWVLKGSVTELQTMGRGCTFDELSKSLLASFEIPGPPLDEQHRIVARIEELTSRAEETRRLRQEAVEGIERSLAASVDAVFHERDDDWTEATVKQLCGKPQYGYTASANNEHVGPRFLRITDIQNGHVNWDSVPYCACDEPEKYRLSDGDIVFARTGATTGKSYLVRNPPESVFASYLIRIRPGERVLPEYIWWYFQSSSYWDAVYSGIDDGNRPNMNGTKLGALKIPFPKSKKTQRQIVSRLETLGEKIAELRELQTTSEAELSIFQPALLAKAFRGEL